MTAASESASSTRRQKRNQLIQRQLLDMILEAGLRPGDPLPTEAELLERIPVARNSLREAMRMLQALGIVEVRHGSGTYLRSTTFDALAEVLEFRATLSMQHERREARELLDLREALEVGLLPRAIEALEPEDLERLAKTVFEMEHAPDPEAFRSHNADFHEVLYDALGNHTLTTLMTAFFKVNTDLFTEDARPEHHPHDSVAAHRRIYEAVAAGDVEAATEALRAHFEPLRRVLEG